MTKPREQVLREKISKCVIKTVESYNDLIAHGCEEIARQELFTMIDVLYKCEIKVWIIYDDKDAFGTGFPEIKMTKICWPAQQHPDTVFKKDYGDQHGC